MRRTFVLAILLTAMTSASAQPPTGLRTRAERTNYEETSSYADVQQFINGLAASSPLVHLESFGATEEGRQLPLVVISDPKVTTPAAARKLGRPLVFVQANIHAGEVEGKEAVLVLARRLVSGDLMPLTRQLVILIAPNYNADGNEKVNAQNRTAQYGPVTGVGTRENAKGLDLNRDYMKLDSCRPTNRWRGWPSTCSSRKATTGWWRGTSSKRAWRPARRIRFTGSPTPRPCDSSSARPARSAGYGTAI